jgi:C-terminal processing protease CtpA/Prc
VPVSKTTFWNSKTDRDIHNLFKELNTNYVDETNPGDLMDNAIKGMLAGLDPYTVYFNEQDVVKI